MASGRVTIGFDNEGYKCVLKNLPKLLVPREDVKKLASTINEFLLNDNLRKRYEKLCLSEGKRYSWDNVGKKIYQIYKQVLKTT